MACDALWQSTVYQSCKLGGIVFLEALFSFSYIAELCWNREFSLLKPTMCCRSFLKSVCILSPKTKANSALPMQPLTCLYLTHGASMNDMICHLNLQSSFLIKRAAKHYDSQVRSILCFNLWSLGEWWEYSKTFSLLWTHPPGTGRISAHQFVKVAVPSDFNGTRHIPHWLLFALFIKSLTLPFQGTFLQS